MNISIDVDDNKVMEVAEKYIANIVEKNINATIGQLSYQTISEMINKAIRNRVNELVTAEMVDAVFTEEDKQELMQYVVKQVVEDIVYCVANRENIE